MALGQGDALQQVGQERTGRTLLGLRSRLFVVEDGEHLRGVGGVGGQQRLQAGVAHREIVETARRDELVVCAEGAGRRRVGQVEVEIEDVLALHGALLVELFHDDVHQEVALLQLAGHLSEQRQYIFLFFIFFVYKKK